MPYYGYIALKLQKKCGKYVLYYVDWTNTLRRYSDPFSFTQEEKEDLCRVFNGRNIVLLHNKEKVLPLLQKELSLSAFHTRRCYNVNGHGTVQQLLNNYVQKYKKKKSFYNYRRDHWLTILSYVNIQLIDKIELSYNEVLMLIQEGLKFCKRRNMSETTLLNYYIEFGMLSVCDQKIRLP